MQQPSNEPTAPGAEPSVRDFLRNVSTQLGKGHQRMAEADPNDPDPHGFDSSELVEWAARRSGITMPDGSWKQYQHLAHAGSTTSVADALRTPGALVFTFPAGDPMGSARPAGAGVGISMGDGRIMEVRQGGQVALTTDASRYTHAAVMEDFADGRNPGADASGIIDRVAAELMDSVDPPDAAEPAAPSESTTVDIIPPPVDHPHDTPDEDVIDAWTRDSDGDGLTDGWETRASRTDPFNPDTDHDGLSDGVEDNSPGGEVSRFDPLKADTDGDGVADGIEAGRGLDPRASDSDHDGWTDAEELGWGTDPTMASDAPHPELREFTPPDEPVATIGDGDGTSGSPTALEPDTSVLDAPIIEIPEPAYDPDEFESLNDIFGPESTDIVDAVPVADEPIN